MKAPPEVTEVAVSRTGNLENPWRYQVVGRVNRQTLKGAGYGATPMEALAEAYKDFEVKKQKRTSDNGEPATEP